MNSNNPQPSRDEIEARLTALLLGELPAAEAELLRWSISQDAGLARVHDQLKKTVGLVREVAASPDEAAVETSVPLKLAEARRQKLLAHFKTIAPKEFAPAPVKQPRKFGWLVPLAAVLVIGAVLAVMFLPSLSGAKRARMSTLGVYDERVSQEEEMLASAKSFKHDKSGEPSRAGGPSANVVLVETNGVEFASAAPQPSLPAATPIALPPPVSSLEDWSSTAGQQIVTAPASDLPGANHFVTRYAFVPSSTGGAGGGGGGAGVSGFGGGGFDGNRGNAGPATIWSQGGSSTDSSAGTTFATTASPLRQGASYSLAGPVETSPSAGYGGVYSQNSAGNVNSMIAPETGLPYQGQLAEKSDRQAFKKSKDEGVVLAGKLDAGPAIVLPPNSTDNAGTVEGAVSITEDGANGQNPEVSAITRLPVPQVTTTSGELAFNSQLSDQGEKNGQLDNGQEANRLYRNRGTLTTTSALQSREQQSVESAFPSTLPAEGPVATSDTLVPSPALPSIPVTDNLSSASSIPAAANPIGAFPGNAPAAQLPSPPASVPVVGNIPVMGHLSQSLDRRALANAPATDDLAPQTPPEVAPVPQPEVATKDNAFSTFSLNVSDVSFKLAAASLEHNVYPQPGSIRSEEFINAFDYRDPEPAAGAPVGFAWERAGDPFAHNRDFLRFSIKTAAEGRAPGRPLNLVLLLDKSGSMERADRVAIIHEALRILATQLGRHDTLSVITFARTARLYVDGVPGSQADDVFGKLSGITPEGGTNLEEAMNLAYQTALRHYRQGGVNRVVLMTDGAANLGNVDPQHFKQKVEANRKQGIALDCFGIGWEDYNDDLLELLASHGDGRYGFLNTPEEAASGFATQLAGALKVAAADVKVQVEFNPARVTAFRQIGYASHQLTKQQFRDNTVDAAVIGAAESGNALYTIQINPQGDGPVATVRVRFRVPGTSEVQEHSWLVPYNGTAVALDQASPAIRLAATAGTFAEWLMASSTTEGLNLDQLLDYLKGVPEVYGTDPRPKQLEWMIRQAKNFSGNEPAVKRGSF